MTENENTHTTASDRPIEYWLRVTDRLVAASFAQAFAAEGVTHGEWRALSTLAGSAPGVSPTLAARDDGHLQSLVARGWVAVVDGAWTLTDAGRAAAERLERVADGVRERIAAAVTGADETLSHQLEALARALGWNEKLAELDDAGAGPGFEHGFGPGRRGFGPAIAGGHGGFRGFRGHGGFREHGGFRGFRGFGPAFAGRGFPRGFGEHGHVPPAADPGSAERGFDGCGPVDPASGPHRGHRSARDGYGPAL
ncbi:MAG: MarR family winged helix-turn-helix transcriptional regulator [Microbacterium sp.]